MKRKFWAVALLVVMSLCLVLTGCSRKKKAVKELEKEFGMSKEEAEALVDFAEELYGDEEEGKPQEEENVSDFVLVEPSAEIKNSKVNDPIVQVYNAVLRTDGSMTVEECINEIQKDFEYSLYGADSTELNMDSLETKTLGSLLIYDKNEKTICSICYCCAVNEPTRVGDCIVYGIEEFGVRGWCNVHSLNIFYAGNICPGVYNVIDDIKESSEYQERVKDYPVLSYKEVPQYLETLGYKNATYTPGYFDGVKDYFEIYFINPEITYTTKDGEMLRCGSIKFCVDMNTATCKAIEYSLNIRPKSSRSDFSDKDFRSLTEDMFLKVEERGKEWIPNGDGAKLVAAVNIGEYNGGENYLIYLLNDGTYFYEHLDNKIDISANGSVDFALKTYGNITGSAASLDEMATVLGCSVSDFVMAK